MRSMLTALALVWALFGCQTLAPTPTSFEVNGNTVQVIGILEGGFEAAPLKQMKAAPKGSTVYLYIFSVGGDPRNAAAFLDAMEDKITVCYADVAGGPAFTILQACTYRLVGEKSLIGNSKPVFQGISGDPDKDKEFRDSIDRMAERFADLEADRLGLSDEQYETLIAKGFEWHGGDNIITNKGADVKLELGCSVRSNIDTLTREIYPNGPEAHVLSIEMTMCPVFRQLIRPEGLPAGQVGEIIGIPLFPVRKI